MRVEKAGLAFIAIIASTVLVAAMALSAGLIDSVRAADSGPNVPHFASVNELEHNNPQAIAEREIGRAHV
jgi:hypothetical protein